MIYIFILLDSQKKILRGSKFRSPKLQHFKIKVVFGIILIYNNINFNSSRSSRRSIK
nr:MAG TPA: hypothetical protein [Caudoviricetes sp.]